MTEVIVVGGVDVGEAHRVVRLLCAEEGRVSVMARQARSSKKRFAGLLDLGARLRVQWKRGRGDLALLTDAEFVRSPDRARRELDRLALLAYGCELVSALSPEGHAAGKLHGLLCVWLDLLEGEVAPSRASRVALEAKALTFAGLQPSLRDCVACGRALADPCTFDAESGGGRHLACGPGARVPVVLLARMEELRRTPLAETTADTTTSTWLLSDFAQHHLGRALNSRGLLDTL